MKRLQTVVVQIVTQSCATLQPHGLQHVSLPCPSLYPRVCSNYVYRVSDAIYLILSRPLLLLPSIFPSIRVFSSESALCIRWSKCWSFNFRSVLPMNIQGWFLLELTGLISLLSKGLSRVFSTTIWEHQFFGTQPHLWSNSHIRWPVSSVG